MLLARKHFSEADPLREAERYCSAMARREAKNFYWGFVSLPYDKRISIYALYDFARQIDDDADGEMQNGAAAKLDAQRIRVQRAVEGEFNDPIMQVLARAIERYAIPPAELHALIDGVAMDLDTTRYGTWEDLRVYCSLVASVVGRMCVRIFGFSDPSALARADELGLALQLVNILRDVREDAAMGRVYLPREDLQRFGVREEDLSSERPSPQWEALIGFEVQRARKLMKTGLEVTRYIPMRSAVCVETMAGIYSRILERIAADPALPLSERASLTKREKVGVMVKAWLRK